MSHIWQENLLKADINISSNGDNIVISPGLAGSGMPSAWENGATYIAIDFVTLMPSSSVTIQFKDGVTNYGGSMVLVANQPFTFENTIQNEHGIITLSPNSNFVINLNGAVQVSGFIRYRLLATN